MTLEKAHDAAFLASVFTYTAGAEDIPPCCWSDVTEAWEATRTIHGFPQYHISGYLTDYFCPDWWWQSQVTNVSDTKWKSGASLHLRKEKELNEARNIVDITTLISSEDGVEAFSSHACWLCLRQGCVEH